MNPEDIDALPPELKTLLDAERALTPAPSAAKARVMAKLTAELFAGAAVGAGAAAQGGAAGAQGAAATGAAATGVTTTAAAGVSAGLVTKLVVGVGVASFAVGGAVGAGVHSALTPPAPTQLASPPRVVEATATPVPVAPVPTPEPVPVVVAPVVPVVTPTVKPEKQKPALSDDNLADERSLMEMARTALSRNDAPAALEALSQHERRFGGGQLAEERMALQVLALSRAGRADDARALAQKFRKQFPQGLFRAVVDGAAPEVP